MRGELRNRLLKFRAQTSLERQNNLNSQEKPETFQGEKCVGSTYQSLECSEHNVCTINSGAGRGRVETDSCFLIFTARGQSGKGGRGPEGWREQGPRTISLQRHESLYGAAMCVRQMSIILFPNERRICTSWPHVLPHCSSSSYISCHSIPPPLRIHIAFCHEEYAHCPP